MTIKWIPKSSGAGRWYESEDKRFAISKRDDYGWYLVDRNTQMILDYDLLVEAKNSATRILEKEARKETQ